MILSVAILTGEKVVVLISSKDGIFTSTMALISTKSLSLLTLFPVPRSMSINVVVVLVVVAVVAVVVIFVVIIVVVVVAYVVAVVVVIVVVVVFIVLYVPATSP